MELVLISNLLVLVGLAFGESDVESRIVTAAQGQERFKPLFELPTWTDLLEAINKNIFCPQAPDFISTWQEDCLTVNDPDTNATSFGGAYGIGSGTREAPSYYELISKPLPEATALFPHGWPAVSPTSSPYMELNLPSELWQGLLSDRARFWDDIYERYSLKPDPPMWANGAVNFKLCGLLQVSVVLLVVRFV